MPPRAEGTKYCFQSMAPLYKNIPGKKPRHIGVAVAFGKSPMISKEVGRVLSELKYDSLVDLYGEINMSCFEECPVELSDEVFVHIFGVESRRFPFKNFH